MVAIETCLNDIRAEVNATCIMLLDNAGQVIASRSRKFGAEQATIGALLAGTFMSSRELSRTMHEQEFKSLIQQGPSESIHAEQIKNQWILAIVFPKHSLLGMVKMMSKQAVAELEVILERVIRSNRLQDRYFSDRMRDSLQDTLDLLFDGFEADNSAQTKAF